ncbi:extracellular guanyl-specific ribonuclease Fl1, partial [Choiromyces venosus 120613-1]
HTFTSAQVSAAANAALDHLNAGTQVGSNDYPHQYNNLEDFAFNSGCRAPYYEFPIFRAYVYTGGSPGADRVVIGSWDGTNAAFCDGITHYGATGNAFLQCSNF